MRKYLFIICLLLTLSQITQGQEVSVNPAAVTHIPTSDHNPTKALLLSLIPGAGQIYNGQAWKIPIIYGALGGVGYFLYDNYVDMKMFKDDYLTRRATGERTIPEYEGYPDESIYRMYQTKNKSFQTFILITAAVYGLNLLDAYIFGHLYDFQINEDLTMNVSPSLTPIYSTAMTFSPTLQVSFTF